MRTNPYTYRNLSVNAAHALIKWCKENGVECDIWDFNFEDTDEIKEVKYVEIGLKDWSEYDQFTGRNS